MAARRTGKLESALYIIIAASLAVVLLDRLLDYSEAVEKAAMEATLANVQSALYLRLAQAVLTGKSVEGEAWKTANPFTLAGGAPANYLGEFEETSPALLQSLDTGKWLFDRRRAELVYLPRQARHLRGGGEGVPALRFRMEVRREFSGMYSGVVLRPAVAFNWLPGT